jgi:hypothetical protein
MIKKAIFSLFLVLVFDMSFAQRNKSMDPIKFLREVLEYVKFPEKDSVFIYAFNFQLTIEKKNHKASVTHIGVNDSLAFTLFPSYKKLHDINFREFLGSKRRICLVIPILMYGSFQKQGAQYDKKQNPLIDLNAALNSNIALYNLDEYSNEKEAKIDFLNRTYHQPQKKAKSWDVKDMIYLSPSIYNMRKVQ